MKNYLSKTSLMLLILCVIPFIYSQSYATDVGGMPWLSLLLGAKHDPNDPRALVIKTSLDTILSDGIDETTITIDVAPYDRTNGIIEDGTIIEFNVISGTAILSSSSVATINGQVEVKLTSLTAGDVSVRAKVKDMMVSSVVNINVVSDFSTLFSKNHDSHGVITYGYYQPGTNFSLTITNNSTRTFYLTMFEVMNGWSIVTNTTDNSLLSDGQLTPNESVYLNVTLNQALNDQGIVCIYYLVDPISGKSFIVSQGWSQVNVNGTVYF